MFRSKKLLLSIGAGSSQLSLIRAAKKLGYAVISIDQDPGAPGFAISDEKIIWSTHDDDQLPKQIENHLHGRELQGIINRSSGPPVLSAARISNRLGLQGIPPGSAMIAIYKHEFRNFCESNRIPSPEFQVIENASEIDFDKLSFPLILKPTLSMVGKSGVSLVHDSKSLEVQFEIVKQYSLRNEVIAEPFMPGQDVVLVSFINRGELLPLGLIDEHNAFDENGHARGCGFSAPSIFSSTEIEERIIEISSDLANALKLQNTPFMISFRLHEGKRPKVIELHLDLGGDLLIEKLFPSLFPFDFINLAIRIAANEPIEALAKNRSPVAIIYERGEGLVSNRPNRLLSAKTTTQLTPLIEKALINA